jgi:surface antigen
MKKLSFICILFVVCFIVNKVDAYSTFTCRNNDFNKEVADTSGGQCVNYVRYETGIPWSGCNGEAFTCYEKAKTDGYAVGHNPYVGSIVIFNKVPNTDLSVGHVGIVKEVNGNNIKIRDSNWVGYETVGEHVIDTSSKDILGYIYCDGEMHDLLNFTFDKASPQGWTTGWDTIEALEPQYNEWRVKVVNNPPHTNPGILSPVLSPGIMAKYTTIKIRAKVFGAIVKDPKETINPILWIRHKDGNWNHKVSMGSILKSDQSYRDYVVDLSSAVGPIFIDVLEVSQFSLELSDGDSGDNEYWYLDSVGILKFD